MKQGFTNIDSQVYKVSKGRIGKFRIRDCTEKWMFGKIRDTSVVAKEIQEGTSMTLSVSGKRIRCQYGSLVNRTTGVSARSVHVGSQALR